MAGASQSFVGEEKEQLVFEDRPAHTGAKLPEIIVHTYGCHRNWSRRRASVFIERVPIWVLVLEETTPVQLVRSALGDHFDLRSGSSAVLRRIRIRQHRDFLY